MSGHLRRNPRNDPRTENQLIHVLKRYRPIGCYRLSDPEFTPAPTPCPYPRKVIMPGLGPHGYAIQIGSGHRADGPCPILTTAGACTLPINHAGPHSDGKWTGIERASRHKRTGLDRGRPADPRYHSTDDFYPVLAEDARELAWHWRKSGESAASISRRTGVLQELAADAKDFPRENAHRLIKHFRQIETSRETLDKHLQSFRLCHPDAGIRFRNGSGPNKPSPYPFQFRPTTTAEVRAYLSATIDTFLTICPAPKTDGILG